MEEAFKARLLVRMATGVALTPAGEVLLKHANAVFRQLECLNADLQPYASGLKGRLRLLANTTATIPSWPMRCRPSWPRIPTWTSSSRKRSPAIS